MPDLGSKLQIDIDEKGEKTFTLQHTYDISQAMDIAKCVSDEENAGRSQDGSVRCLGYIPPEEWNFDMHLIAAKHARNRGDMGEYVKNVKKFFEFNPQFSVEYRKRFF